MTASVARRRRSAHAAAIAAKQRRQKIFLGVLLAGVIALLAWELPGILHHLKGGSSSVGAPVATSTPPAKPRTLPKAFRGRGGDPFQTRVVRDGDSQVGPATGNDPFAPLSSSASASSSSSASVSAPTASQPLPEQIVIGKPSGRVASRGWIVILASIPRRNGRASADSVANSARRSGVGSVSVLNSSARKPLRGGYWVVYTGPVKTLSAVEGLAAGVHARGYGDAYLRELVIYK